MTTAKPKKRGYALSIDKKGRVTIPVEARKQLELNEGDVIYLRVASNSKTGVFKKAIDPFVVIRADALRQSKQGETTSFDSLMAELGISDEV